MDEESLKKTRLFKGHDKMTTFIGTLGFTSLETPIVMARLSKVNSSKVLFTPIIPWYGTSM